MLLLQALVPTVLPLMVGTAIVLALWHDSPEFTLLLSLMVELGVVWMNIGHLEHESKGSSLAKPGVPARSRYESAGRRAEGRQEGHEKEKSVGKFALDIETLQHLDGAEYEGMRWHYEKRGWKQNEGFC
jgi:hypothetical protein